MRKYMNSMLYKVTYLDLFDLRFYSLEMQIEEKKYDMDKHKKHEVNQAIFLCRQLDL